MSGLEDLDEVLKEYKSGHKVVCALPRHVPYLIKNLRSEDLLEVQCFSDTPEKAFLIALSNDETTMTVLAPDNIPYAMFGVGYSDEGTYIWMLGTTDVLKYKYEFIKRCREWVWAFVGIYEKVYNYVHVDNKLAIKWLKWCGAEFENEYIIKEERFLKFMITKDNI
jgi:hypothetical protein